MTDGRNGAGRIVSSRRAVLGAAAALAFGALGASGSAQAAEPILIGMVAPLTGAAAETGRYQINGAKLAVETVNRAGGVLGRPLALSIEDDQTTNPGAVLAFNKLASDDKVVAILGPIRSTQVQAIAPSVKTAARPVAFGGTDPRLTKLGNPWLFRFRPNDETSTRAMAAFGIDDLSKKSWAVVYSTDAFGSSSMKLLVEALKGRGVTPTIVQGFTTGTQDFTPVVLAVKQAGGDLVASFATSETDQAIMAKQLRQVGVTAPIIGSASLASATAIKLAGADLNGSYALSDFNVAASPEASAFAKAYEAAYGTAPDFFSSWAYDAVDVFAAAIAKASSVAPDAMRQAVLSLNGFKGVEGTYDFDAAGDGLDGYNIVQIRDGVATFVKRVQLKR